MADTEILPRSSSFQSLLRDYCTSRNLSECCQPVFLQSKYKWIRGEKEGWKGGMKRGGKVNQPSVRVPGIQVDILVIRVRKPATKCLRIADPPQRCSIHPRLAPPCPGDCKQRRVSRRPHLLQVHWARCFASTAGIQSCSQDCKSVGDNFHTHRGEPWFVCPEDRPHKLRRYQQCLVDIARLRPGRWSHHWTRILLPSPLRVEGVCKAANRHRPGYN
eukprot:COSAG06_NODE_4893_length_3877_cov_5.358391_3_plen_217_part_00